MSIHIEDRIIENATVIESCGYYVTTVTEGIPKATLLAEMEQKNYVMIGIPMMTSLGSMRSTYINWKWISPK